MPCPAQVNTLSVRRTSSAVLHTTPCWNISIDETNKEQVDRYLKRQQRHPAFVRGVGALATTAAACARQNSTVDMYELYYDGDTGESLTEVLNPALQPVATLR